MKRQRRAINLSIDSELLDQAKKSKVNLSRAAEAGIEREMVAMMESNWREANREALESSNAYIEKSGLPLMKYRQF